MNVAVVSYPTKLISEPNLSDTASILLNSPIDIELQLFFNIDI